MPQPVMLKELNLNGSMKTYREGNGTPLQYSCLKHPMDRGAWWAAVYGVAKSWTWLSDFTFTFHFPALEKEMATQSSTLAWRIPWMEEPGGLQSMGSHRVGHDWSDLAAAAWRPTKHYRTNTPKKVFFSLLGSGMQKWEIRDTWSNRQIQP